MKTNKLLKGLLGASVAAAMFGATTAHAQSSDAARNTQGTGTGTSASSSMGDQSSGSSSAATICCDA